jgi:hypothetical protein
MGVVLKQRTAFFLQGSIILIMSESSSTSLRAPNSLNSGGVVLCLEESNFLHTLARLCRGEIDYGDETLVSQREGLGLRERDVMFLCEAFREGGDVSRVFSPREVSVFLHKRAVGRLMDWGVGEGLCDNGHLTKEEMGAYLARVFRGTEDLKERQWAFEQWSKLHDNEEKRKASGSRAGSGVNIVIIDPYQRGAGGSPVSVGGKDISGVVDVSD